MAPMGKRLTIVQASTGYFRCMYDGPTLVCVSVGVFVPGVTGELTGDTGDTGDTGVRLKHPTGRDTIE